MSESAGYIFLVAICLSILLLALGIFRDVGKNHVSINLRKDKQDKLLQKNSDSLMQNSHALKAVSEANKEIARTTKEVQQDTREVLGFLRSK